MIQKLINFQTVDAKLRKIETELAQSEERKKYLQAKKFLETVDETLSRMDARAAELNLFFAKLTEDSKKLAEALADYDSAAAHGESKEEVEYLSKKTAELLEKMRRLEGEAVRLEKEMDEVMKSYNDLKNKTKAAQQMYVEYSQKYKALKESRAEEKKAIEEELTALAKDIPADLKQKYAAKRADKIFPIVVKVSGDCCVCGMEFSLSAKEKLGNGEMTECENCHRFVYKG